MKPVLSQTTILGPDRAARNYIFLSLVYLRFEASYSHDFPASASCFLLRGSPLSVPVDLKGLALMTNDRRKPAASVAATTAPTTDLVSAPAPAPAPAPPAKASPTRARITTAQPDPAATLESLRDVEIETRERHQSAEEPQPRHPPRRAAVPGLFSRRSINLLIGSSTSGKTLLALSQLENYVTSGSFLNHQLPADHLPDQCGAIVCAGTLESLYNNITSMDLETLSDLTRFPIRDWDPSSGETPLETLERLHDALGKASRQPIHFLFVDGLQLMLEGSGKVNDPRAVRDFYKLLQQFCLDRDVTILATIGTAKMRRGESYPLLADRVYGSTVWAQEAETLIGIEQVRLELPEERRPKYRRLIIQPKGRVRSQVIYADFDDQGRLLVIERTADDTDSPIYSDLDGLLDKAAPGTELTKDALLAWGETLGASGRTVERWVASRCDESLGMLEKLGNNRTRTFRKPFCN